MRILLLLAGAAGLALTAPVAADQGKGGGHGRGGDRGDEQRGRGNDDHEERGRGDDDREERGRGDDDREERFRERQERRIERAERREERRFEREERRAEHEVEREERRAGRGAGRAQRRAERRAVAVTDAAQLARLRWDDDFPGVRGCPPGLARRNNGCMPPGLARQQAAQQGWYNSWWNYPREGADYVYDAGHLYRLSQNGSVAGYIPLLGGALWPGQAWPSSFRAADVPDYHLDYFGLRDGYDYRLADGAIYGVDPATQAIRQVAALVTGDQWNIGQRMPDGYGVYNVPYAYRDQYPDTPDSLYRYSDGYVYQVDPATQLIQAAIQLIV